MTRPDFPAPRKGVFQDPVPVVKSTDDELLPSIVPANPLIAYAAKVERNLDIYVRPLAGGAPFRLTTHSADDTDPAFSPNGRWIAWTSQADDVKGDIWFMRSDGDDKQQLTDRATADRGATWSPDGRTIYFTSQARGGLSERVDALDIGDAYRQTVVDAGWDPAVSVDGRFLFYVALDDRPQPRLYVKRLHDGRVAALTDGAYIEGIPRVALGLATTRVLFTRWIDDQTGDGVVDVDDVPSLWSVDFDEAIFKNGQPLVARPLTSGEGGEIFASMVSDWLVYTAAGYGDLEIYALPADGAIHAGAGPEAILQAARAEDNPSTRRLALRYLVSTSPELAASARYELARELAERGRYSDAIDELQYVQTEAVDAGLRVVAQLETERLRMLNHLRGTLLVREASERRFLADAARRVAEIRSRHPEQKAAQIRAQSITAEIDFAVGRRDRALAAFIEISKREDVSSEDGARALDRLGEAIAAWQDLDAVARVSARLLGRFPDERFYAVRAANRWIDCAQAAPTVAAANLEQIVRAHPDLPVVAARAEVALAKEQERNQQERVALQEWKRIATQYDGERSLQADALLTLGLAAERQGEQVEAIDAYEQLIARFPEKVRLRSRALQGLTRIAMIKAHNEERQGKWTAARDSYARLLRTNPEIVVAHRRYIALSFQIGQGDAVLAQYQRAAAARPRDKYARYGYGYALTFQTPPALKAAQRQIEAALGLDPRLAAAHLTLGWIREQRDRHDPRGGWLEKASQSYETAWSLFDPNADTDLWAAAKLNSGNVFLALGKTDYAFDAYLDRELSGVPFGNPLTELLFRQRFAQTALREERFDVALDMAHRGFDRAQEMPGQPRQGVMAALLGSVNFVIQSYPDALAWFDRAEAIYRQRRDWARVTPMLRGKSLAQQAMGDLDSALDNVEAILEILDANPDRTDLRYCWSKPVITLFGLGIPVRLDALDQEIPANPRSVTGAICGFSLDQESEIATATAAKLLRTRGDLTAARRFDQQRLTLIRRFLNDAKRGPRIRRELLHALNDSALLAARSGALDDALARWQRALPVARELSAWAEAATMLESVLHVWIQNENVDAPKLTEETLLTATAGLEATASTASALSQRFARWLALFHLRRALLPPPSRPAATAARARLEGLLGNLDQASRELDTATDYGHLANIDPAVGDDIVRALSHMAGTEPTATEASTPSAPPEAPDSWRIRFDRSLWDKPAGSRGPDPRWLLAAVEAFEVKPQPAPGLERPAFLAAATRLLVTKNQSERAWRLLERDRLLTLQPHPRRVGRTPLSEQWHTLRDQRTDPEAYRNKLAKAPALVRALEGAPATVAEIQQTLGDRGVLVQVFSPLPNAPHFFAVDSFGVSHIAGDSGNPTAIPEALLAHLPEPDSPERPTIFLDQGELFDRAETLTFRDQPLAHTFSVVEVLSATYLVAANRARNLAREDMVVFGDTPSGDGAIVVPGSMVHRDTLANQGQARQIIHLTVPATLVDPGSHRPGETQISFATPPDTPSAKRLDLDRIAGLPLFANVAVVDRLPVGARASRAVAQAFLLAGVPSVITRSTNVVPTDELTRLAKALARDPIVDAAAAVRGTTAERSVTHLYGDCGQSFAERVDFAVAEYERLDKMGRAAYAAARRARDNRDLWQNARQIYVTLLDTIAFLKTGPSLARLRQTDRSSLAGKLSGLEVQRQVVLAQVLFSLNETDEGVALQDLVAQNFERQGARSFKYAAKVLDLVGQNLAMAKRHTEARERFSHCARLAHEAGIDDIEADCLSRLGSEKRALFDNAGAQKAYEGALALYQKNRSPNQIHTRRFLGFLFESSLNDYARALDQFEQALATAEQLEVSSLIPGLMLDIARIYQTRGDYEQALAQALQAEDKLAGASDKDQADVALAIAKIYWYRGNYRRALERQQQGLELARRARDVFREIQAISLAGLIALNQAELQQAERAISSALQLSRVTGRRGEEAKQLNNLGFVLRQAGRVPEAVQRFREALAIDEELGSIEGRAYDLRNLAVALHRKGEYREALARVTEALELSRSIGEQYNQLQALFAAGEILEALGDATKSEERFAEAAELAHRTAVPEVEWRSLYALGRFARRNGSPNKARRLLERAVDVAERLGRGQSGTSIDHNRDDLYADLLELALADDDLTAAHLFLERARARQLLDILATHTVELPSPAAQRALAAELRAREAYLAAVRDSTDPDASHGSKPVTLRKNYERARATLRRNFPRLSRAFTIDPVALPDLQKALPPRTTVASFYVGRSKTIVLVVDHAQARSVSLPLGHDALVTRVQTIREAMRAFGPVDGPLTDLAHLLLPPLRDALKDTHTLIVIPHGPLHHVPFAALPRDQQPLIQQMTVAMAPSGSFLFDLLQQPRRRPPSRIQVLAPAVDLPFARLEALAIAGRNARLGKTATEQALRTSTADALAVAAHGELKGTDPLASTIVLHPDPTHDGRLDLHEVFALDSLPPLVTLSACDSSASDAEGQEWLGLGGAFLTAGAQTVIATQNRISDLAASVIMKRFYRLIRAKPAGEALREAALLTRQYFPHPAHWANFVLLGDYR